MFEAMKKQKKLEIETIGEPSVAALFESEQKVFYETLLTRIKELAAEDDKKKLEGTIKHSND